MTTKKRYFIILVLAVFIALEITARLPTTEIPTPPARKRRVMLFAKGENFQNVEKHFKYMPNKEIYSETYYTLGELCYKEYSSTIFTNNMGLVQKRDIPAGSKVRLILGDSFAEGQGATPWFYAFDDLALQRGINFLNGAILGTSPTQWEMLKDKLQKDFNLTYDSVNIILLGGAISGGPWQFSDDGLLCLRTADCPNPFGDFFGYDFHGKDAQQIQSDALNLHLASISQEPIAEETPGTWQNIKNILKQSAFLHKSVVYIKANLLSPTTPPIDTTPIITSNLDTLRRLVHAGENKGFIVLVTTRHETGSPPKWDPHSLRFMEYAQQHDLPYEICELDKADFFLVDGHPHAGGYEKIRECVERASRL